MRIKRHHIDEERPRTKSYYPARPKCYTITSAQFYAGEVFKTRDLRDEAEKKRAQLEALKIRLEALPREIANLEQQIITIEKELKPWPETGKK